MIPDGLTQVGVEVSRFPWFVAGAALVAVIFAIFARKYRSDPRRFQDFAVLTVVAPGTLIGAGHLSDHGAEMPGIYEARGTITKVRPLDTSGRQAVWVDSFLGGTSPRRAVRPVPSLAC